MQTVLVFHNLLRWAVVIFALWVLFSSISGVLGKRTYSKSDDRGNLFFMISMDIQLLLGLILYFTNSWMDGLKDLKNPATRFFSLEHMAMMILAWILVHVGRVSVKRAATDGAKHKRSLIFFGIAIILIALAVPWPGRAVEVARPWIRGFN